MKLHFLYLSLSIILFGCNSNNKQIVTDANITVSSKKKPQTPKEYVPKTGSIVKLAEDTILAPKRDFQGKYLVADKYLLDVKTNSNNETAINWDGFDQILYRNETCSYQNLICFSSSNPDYGKFFMNVKSGKLLHQIVEKPGDTLYYEVKELKKNPKFSSEFEGHYSIISPKQDSVKFIMKAQSPFRYEYSLDTGKKSIVYYRGRDEVGLMHYSNALTMNSDHLSGLYKWNDDSNGTVVKLAE